MRWIAKALLFSGLFGCILIVADPASVQAQSGQQQIPPANTVGDRVAEVEEQLIDLQVQIATLRSLAANEAPAATGVAQQSTITPRQPSSDSPQRIAALEAQVTTLSAEIRQLSGKPSSIMPSATTALRPRQDNRQPPVTPRVTPPTGAQGSASGWSTTTNSSNTGPNAGQTGIVQNRQTNGRDDAGTRGEILPGQVFPGYPSNRTAPSGNNSGGSNIAGWSKPEPPAGQPVVSDAEAEYQKAYGFLLQQDYGAAQTAFQEFLSRHSNTPLAGNAQYWIGETHYARGAYKPAAIAFLKGYEKYGDGNKGPDSLLKLAMSLAKLKQTDAACSSLRELGTRYAQGADTVLARAKKEQRRLRCPN